MKIAPTIISEIIHGKRNLTAALALKLEKALDINAFMWMRLQVKYDIDSLRIKERDKRKHNVKPYSMIASHAIAREPATKYHKSKSHKTT